MRVRHAGAAPPCNSAKLRGREVGPAVAVGKFDVAGKRLEDGNAPGSVHVTADIVFGDDGSAILTIDGDRTYMVDVRTGGVAAR